jgi:hypothetical protein
MLASGSEDLPEAVAEAQRERPDCSYGVESATSFSIVNGAASRRTDKRWFQQCPGERRRLLYAEGTGAAPAEAAAGGGADWPGGSDVLDGLPDIDAFLRDFLGATPWLQPGGGGRDGAEGGIPFPFPLPPPRRPPIADVPLLPPWLQDGDSAAAGGDGGSGGGDGTGGGRGGAGPRRQPLDDEERRGAGGGGPAPLAKRERGRGVYI